MISINKSNREKCCGCTACAQVCVNSCITMCKDKMGFIYPIVDTKRCVNCGLCDSVCGAGIPSLSNNYERQVYAALALAPDIRVSSSSGGIFGLISRYVISQNGIVFGAAFDETFHKVKHIFVDSEEELFKIQGSKYVQSELGSSYVQVKNYLEQGRLVLFSGTPCQVSGLQGFLGRKYENLLLIDIVCHGVPSPEVWDEYIGWLEKRHQGKAVSASFRDKRNGWRNYALLVTFDNGKKYIKKRSKDLYMRGFLHNYYLRPSCFNCNYKGLDTISDITLGDLWGAEKICPQFYDNKGTSLVITSSLKGELFFDKVSSYIKCKKINLDEVISYNSSIVKSAEINEKSIDFENTFKTRCFNSVFKKYCSSSLYKRIIKKIKHIL